MSDEAAVIYLDEPGDPVANAALDAMADEAARGPHPDNVYVNALPLSAPVRRAMAGKPQWAATLEADRFWREMHPEQGA